MREEAQLERILDPLFLPFSEPELCLHFVDSGPQHVAKWRKRLADAALKHANDPSFLHRDETLWTAGALLAIHDHPDRAARWEHLLRGAFGEQPPLDTPTTWDKFLDGDLCLYFEVGLRSPESYRRWLRDHLHRRHPLVAQVEHGRSRANELEGHTKLDGLLLNASGGYAVHFEAKVLSDVAPRTSFDALRNQLARNLDAMNADPPRGGALSKRNPERSLLALLTPELFREHPRSRLYGYLYDDYREHRGHLAEDLPHLHPSASESLSRRLGWLTFEDVIHTDPSACLWLSDDEDPIGHATLAAAKRLEALDGLGKRVRERQLQEALAAVLPRAEVERGIQIPGWDPQPGHIDVLTRDTEGRVDRVIETKLKSTNDIYECLWDLAKVLSVGRADGPVAAYLVVGTTKDGWRRHATHELFVSGRHGLVETIRAHLAWWDKYILGDSTGRPLAVAASVDIRVLARASLKLRGVEWELRAIRVFARDPWVPFHAGRPDGAPPVGSGAT